MEHRLRRKQFNSDTNASNKKYLKEIQEKRKEETFSSEKMKKIKSKRKDQKREKKKEGKKEKRGPKGRGTHLPRWAQKLIFHIRTVKRNRNEIDAKKKSDFQHPTKKKKMKMKENERK